MEGLKRKRRCQLECFDHIFDIRTLKSNTSKYDINLSFCPKFQRQPLPPEHTFPQYNHDGKYYTSAFILGVDRRVLIKNQQQQLMDHQKQIRDSLQKHNQLIFPRPNSKHSLCSVCKETYKNYYGHISSQTHREKINLSLYNNHIKQLCRRYIDLWDGAEQRADEQALKKQQEEQQMREKMQQIQYQPINQNEDEEEYLEQEPPKKSTKKSSSQGRTYRSQYMRKKLLNSSVYNPEHFQRQKKQNKYERERERIKLIQKQGTQLNKEYIKVPQKQGDVFIIMKCSSPSNPPNPPNPPNPLNLPNPPVSIQTQQGHGQFIWKRNTEKIKRQSQKIIQKRVDQDLQSQKNYDYHQKYHQKYLVGNKMYESQYIIQEKTVQRPDNVSIDKIQTKAQPKNPFPYYPYPHSTHHPHNPDYKFFNQNGKHPNDNIKGAIHPPSPYYPYNYYMPVYDHPYKKNEKGYDHLSNSKDKSKIGQKSSYGEKSYGYPYPQWQYPPYYMPIPQPPAVSANHSAHQNSVHNDTPPKSLPLKNSYENPYEYNASINITVPMYMCHPPPPAHHPSGAMPYSIPPSRYSMPQNMNLPYMNYQYPYMSQPPPGPSRQGEFTGQPNKPSAPHNSMHHNSSNYMSSNPKNLFSSYQNQTNYSLNQYNQGQQMPPSSGPNKNYNNSYNGGYNNSQYYNQHQSKDHQNSSINPK